MSDRAASSQPDPKAAPGRPLAAAVVVILFAAMLLFGILVALRYAYGWFAVTSAL